VVHAADGLRLALKPRDELRIVHQVLVQRFHGDQAVQLQHPGAVHLAHAARTNALQHLVAVVQDLSDE
jgi:hypothetical protein